MKSEEAIEKFWELVKTEMTDADDVLLVAIGADYDAVLVERGAQCRGEVYRYGEVIEKMYLHAAEAKREALLAELEEEDLPEEEALRREDRINESDANEVLDWQTWLEHQNWIEEEIAAAVEEYEAAV